MFNLIYTIWNPSEKLINKHINTWATYSEETREQLNIIWIDDYSDKQFKLDIPFKINFTLARITDNIYWNICGAKNLGANLASNDWILLTEQDHLITKENLEQIIDFNKQQNHVYYLNRKRINLSGPGKNKPHPNSFIIHKEDFWNLGGYDEDFSGHRGHSDHMIKELMKKYKFVIDKCPAYLTEYNEFKCIDPKNKDISKNRNHNRILIDKKTRLLKDKKYLPGKILRFNWEIIQNVKFD